MSESISPKKPIILESSWDSEGGYHWLLICHTHRPTTLVHLTRVWWFNLAHPPTRARSRARVVGWGYEIGSVSMCQRRDPSRSRDLKPQNNGILSCVCSNRPLFQPSQMYNEFVLSSPLTVKPHLNPINNECPLNHLITNNVLSRLARRLVQPTNCARRTKTAET